MKIMIEVLVGCQHVWFTSSQKMADKCFRKCINYPGTELDNKEQVS